MPAAGVAAELPLRGARARDAIARETALLGLRIAAADRLWHEELDALFGQALKNIFRHCRLAGNFSSITQGVNAVEQLAAYLHLDIDIKKAVSGA